MAHKKNLLYTLIAFILFLLASIYITFPLIFHFGNYATGWGDELVIAWIQAWVRHALFTNPLLLFNANIIYPYPNTLAYSDAFITGSLFSFLPVYLFGQPIAANNSILISSLLFDGFSIYLLTYYITKDFFASLLAGSLFIFSPAVLSFDVHLQIFSIALVPLSILSFLLFLDKKKTIYLIFTLLAFFLQAYNSFLPGYFIVFSIIIVLIFKGFENKKELSKFFSKKNIFLILITFLLILPVIIPYYQVSKEFNYTRDIRDTIHFALQPEDFLYPGNTTRLESLLLTIPTNQHSQNNEFKPGYLGAIFTLLIIFSFILLIKKRKKITFHEKLFLTISLFGFILSLGPFLHLDRQTIHHPFPIPLPYILFYYIVPGFDGLRNTARWEMLFILASAILIGLVVSRFLSDVDTKIKFITYLIFFLGIVIEFNPIKFVAIPQKQDFPKVYSWMATTPANSTFIELPIYNWDTTPYVQQELFREYYSTENFRKIVNGYTGFSPPPWENLITYLHQQFPSNKSIEKLHLVGVQYIVVNKNDFDIGYKARFEKYSGDQIIETLRKDHSVSLIKSFKGYYVFVIDAKK